MHRQIIQASRSKSNKIFRLLKKIRQADLVENKLPSRITGYGMSFEAPGVLEGLRELFRLQTTIDYNERFDEKAFEMAEEVIQSRLATQWTKEEYCAIQISCPSARRNKI